MVTRGTASPWKDARGATHRQVNDKEVQTTHRRLITTLVSPRGLTPMGSAPGTNRPVKDLAVLQASIPVLSSIS